MLQEKRLRNAQEVLRVAEDLFRQDPDWVTFFREVLSIDGIVRQAFPEGPELTQFEASEEFAKIQEMLARLRERGAEKPTFQESTRVITVRMPRSLHQSLQDEAHRRRTSMNKLCIAKLLQLVDDELLQKAVE